MVETPIKIGNVEFQNPIFVASGTFGYGTENAELVDVNRLGAIITKSITQKPREGNPPPRIAETPSGMLNSIGLANMGVDKFIKEVLPKYETFETKVITNIAGSTMDEYARVLEQVESVGHCLCGYEINISCPNVERGGMEFGVDCDMTLALTKELRKRTGKLLIMKLSPNVTDVTSIARAAEEGGADALSAINTMVGMSIDIETRKPHIFAKFGGLSGPAIRPVGIATVHKVFNAVDIPVIGIGGITNGRDVVQYLLAGASAVQIGTANFRDPRTALVALEELVYYCDKHGIEHVSHLTGALKGHA